MNERASRPSQLLWSFHHAGAQFGYRSCSGLEICVFDTPVKSTLSHLARALKITTLALVSELAQLKLIAFCHFSKIVDEVHDQR